jgi:Transposase DDE domain
MLFLHSHHIVDLYCWVDDTVPGSPPQKTGRPALVSDTEILTILIWNTVVLKQSTLKDIFNAISLYHQKDFKTLPKYSAFVSHCHKAIPQFLELLEMLLQASPIGIVDSTMLPVCKIHRADSHKVAKGKAQFGKNWQGWHYGFKLHTTITLGGLLSSIHFTGANIYDAQALPYIINKQQILVGDTLYGASVMRKRIWKEFGCAIISPPFPKQNRKIIAPWQNILLNTRSKIESVFDYLKNHLHLVSSFPRSMGGYLIHYLRVLVSYQIMALVQRG